jgi:hypothetical protein
VLTIAKRDNMTVKEGAWRRIEAMGADVQQQLGRAGERVRVALAARLRLEGCSPAFS